MPLIVASVFLLLCGEPIVHKPVFDRHEKDEAFSQADKKLPNKAMTGQNVNYLHAEEFQFEISAEYPSLCPSKPPGRKEVVRHDLRKL
jgi:hypothetical protein